MKLRKAYSKVSQELSDTQLDILARLQFLEGALKSRSAKDKLEWIKGKPLRAALAEATTYIQENYGELPEISRYTWITKESTGFYRDVRRRLLPLLKQSTTAPDDIMQMLLTGMNPSGETFYIDKNNEKMELDRMFQVAGFKSRAMLRRDFSNRDGKLTPYDFSNIIASWAQKKALIMIKMETRDKKRREKYWGEELHPPGDTWDGPSSTWEGEAQDVSSVLPGEAVHEDWGAQSEAWAFSSMLFHTDTPEAQRVRDWLYNVVFPQHTAVDITMRTLFDMLEEGNWDVSGSKPLLRLQKMNEELAKRVGKALGKDMSPNAKGQYTKLNAAREAGFKKITQATENLKKVDVRALREEETNIQKFLDGLAQRAEGVPNTKAKAELSAAHREQQANRKAVKDLRAQIESLQTQATSRGGVSPRVVKNLAKVKEELSAVRSSLTAKRKEYRALQAEAVTSAKPPLAIRKQLATAKKELALRGDAVEVADAAFMEAQRAAETSPRLTPKLRKQLDNTRKAKRKARLQYTLQRKALDALAAEAIATAVLPRKLQATMTKVEGELQVLSVKFKDSSTKAKALEERVNAGGTAQRNTAAISNLQAQLASYEQKSEETRQQIYLLENAAKGGLPTAEEKVEAAEATKALQVIRGKLSLLTMLDAMELSGMGFGRLRKAKTLSAHRILYRWARKRGASWQRIRGRA